MAIAVAVVLLALELVARFYFGLGDPPLSVADPEIEYLFRPSSEYRRFGNRVAYNRFSMRSDEVTPRKAAPDELRVLVIGDSIVNGGALTDQRELATSLLSDRLTRETGRPVTVMNVSAGSWGAPNQLAYVRRFGLFDADVVVVVSNSDDPNDVVTSDAAVDVHPDLPGSKPLLALQELLTRYVPRYLPAHRAKTDLAGTRPAAIDPGNAAVSLAALKQLLRAASASGARVLLVQHLKPVELGGREEPGFYMTRSVAEDVGVPTASLGPVFEQAMARGEMPYRDSIHPNARGQALMADVLEREILRTIPASAPTTAAAPRPAPTP